MKIIEIELSSHFLHVVVGVNGQCSDNENVFYEKTDITLENLEKWFDGVDLTDTKITCGVLGDPIFNPELYEILWYFLFEKENKRLRDINQRRI